MNSHDKISRNSLVSEYPCKWVENMDYKDFRDYHITEFFVYIIFSGLSYNWIFCLYNFSGLSYYKDFFCVSIISWIWCAENELMKIQLTSNVSDDCSCTICIWIVFTTDKRWRILFIPCSKSIISGWKRCKTAEKFRLQLPYKWVKRHQIISKWLPCKWIPL